MYRITGDDGRKIAAYKFGNPSDTRATQLSGRTAFSTKIKNALISQYTARCNIYQHPFPTRELQIDHRIPFEIIGDNNQLSHDINEYMLVCASANRAKSWSCEHCPNWKNRNAQICKSCYWAYPESYTHIAMRDIRRLDLLWSGKETKDYDSLIKKANKDKEDVPECVKKILHEHLTGK